MAYQKTLITHIKDSDLTGDGDKLVTMDTGDSLTTGVPVTIDGDGNANTDATRTGNTTVFATGGSGDGKSANVPLIYDANGNVISTTSRTGTTTNYATATAGSKTTGNYPKWDASGNLTDGDTGGSGSGVPWFYSYFPFTEPVLGDFTLLDTDATATTSSASGGIRLTVPNKTTTRWALLKKSAPSTPYKVDFSAFGDFVGTWGLFLRDSADGKMQFVRFELNSFTATIRVDTWSNQDTFNAAQLANTACGFSAPVITLRWEDDGTTNRTASFSTNGADFTQVYQASRTVWGTPDEVGFGLLPQNAAFGGAGTWNVHLTAVNWTES